MAKLVKIFAEVISNAGLKQFRIAETEKYAHATFFFNGGIETPYPGEDRMLIPSPNVATYDEKPEMSAVEVTASLVEAVESAKYDFIFVHTLVPHRPYGFNKKCHYDGSLSLNNRYAEINITRPIRASGVINRLS